MSALRFLGGLFLLLAAVVLIADLTNARGPLSTGLWVSAATHWSNLAPTSFAAAQKSIQATSRVLWDPVVKSLLAIPAWLMLGTVGAALAHAGRRRKRINIFVN